MTVWVVDTSPLIFLSHLDRLDLLRRGGREVVIPRAVLFEVVARQDSAAAAIHAACESWLVVKEVRDRAAVEFVNVDLHAGEAEAIVLAKELAVEWLVMDDQKARQCATRAGLKVVGTLGLLLAAKRKGQVPSVRREIEKLQEAGFRASPRLVTAVLEQAGE